MGLSGRHAELLDEAIAADGRAFRALIEGRADDARAGLAEAAALYRRSWEAAPPRSYGRLAGHLTSAVLASAKEAGGTLDAAGAIEAWRSKRTVPVQRIDQLFADLRQVGKIELSMLAVANRALRSVME